MNEPERRDAGGGDLTQQENEPPTSAGGAAATERGSKRKAKAPIGSVGELIRRNYESRAGVKKLQRTDVRAIVQAPALEETEQAELLALARADTKLQQTKQLLMLSIRTETPKIANGLRGFAREVLAGHPLFQGKTMAGVLANPQSMSMDAAVSALASADAKGLSTDPDKPLPRGQADRIRTNAVHCLLLLLRASQGLSLLRIQRALHKHVWAPKARRHRTDSEKLEVLVASRDPSAASVTFALLEGEATLQKQRAQAAARSEERAQSRVRELEQRVAELERNVDDTTGQCAELRAQLDEATESHAASDARWKDDYERLKGRTLNRLIEESSLLKEGLHALQREPPKVRVMIDHAERAIEGLEHEAKQIRRDTVR